MTDQTREISLEEFASRHPDGLTVDVRERAEYTQAHVPGAVLVPMSQLTSRMDELDRSRTVHVVCASGGRSKAMTDVLVSAGFDAVSVAGGTQGWIDSGRHVEVGL